MWHIYNRYQEQISKKYWAETKSCQLTLLRMWSYSYLLNPLIATIYSGWKTSYQQSDLHKALHHCILFQFYMQRFFNKYKLDFCNNLSTAVVYLGATHKHDPVCQPQGVFKRLPTTTFRKCSTLFATIIYGNPDKLTEKTNRNIHWIAPAFFCSLESK